MPLKEWQLLNGRDFVTPEDIKDVVVPVLRHRVIVSPEKEMEGLKAEQIIAEIVAGIEVPR
jgi:MoxR-like ATPase